MVVEQTERALGLTTQATPRLALEMIVEQVLEALQKGRLEARAVTKSGLPCRIPPACWREAFDDLDGPLEFSKVELAVWLPVLGGGAFGAYAGLTASIDAHAAAQFSEETGRRLATVPEIAEALRPLSVSASARLRAARLDPDLPAAIDALHTPGAPLPKQYTLASMMLPASGRGDPKAKEASRWRIRQWWPDIKTIWPEWA